MIILKVVVALCAQKYYYALHYACESNACDVVQLLLSNGASTKGHARVSQYVI